MNILQLSTYPIEPPDHGGKIRTWNIRKVLRKSYDVQTLTFEFGDQDAITGFNITLDYNAFMEIVESPHFGDWGINTYLEHREGLLNKVALAISRYKPDIVLVEQGYLWPLAKMMIEMGAIHNDIFVIYSSHNIEYLMKRDIYKEAFSGAQLDHYVNHVKEIEYGVIRRANLVFAVSEQDKEYIKQLVSDNTPVHMFRNGHSGVVHTCKVDLWKNKYLDANRNWVYVASWHGPNIKGLYKLINGGLHSSVNDQALLWVLGGVGPGLKDFYNMVPDDKSSVRIVGQADVETIDSAIAESIGIVLPIWEGGGSNLKTAQALLSNKVIIGTNHSFRGYEEFKHDEGVYLTDNPAEMVGLMRSLKAMPEINRRNAARKLKWESILEAMPSLVEKTWSNYSLIGRNK
jgi:glycosyltransferase involved in cell wall biosynthesis